MATVSQLSLLGDILKEHKCAKVWQKKVAVSLKMQLLAILVCS